MFGIFVTNLKKHVSKFREMQEKGDDELNHPLGFVLSIADIKGKPVNNLVELSSPPVISGGGGKRSDS